MKKLYRLKQNGKIAGICAGVADLFEIDVTIVRLLFILFAILIPVLPAMVMYLAAWWLVPEKELEKETKI
ncbi:MAG: PspC domain-containing protein [Chitinispirillaceae bacterium]|jgi:phage shock protein C